MEHMDIFLYIIYIYISHTHTDLTSSQSMGFGVTASNLVHKNSRSLWKTSRCRTSHTRRQFFSGGCWLGCWTDVQHESLFVPRSQNAMNLGSDPKKKDSCFVKVFLRKNDDSWWWIFSVRRCFFHIFKVFGCLHQECVFTICHLMVGPFACCKPSDWNPSIWKERKTCRDNHLGGASRLIWAVGMYWTWNALRKTATFGSDRRNTPWNTSCLPGHQIVVKWFWHLALEPWGAWMIGVLHGLWMGEFATKTKEAEHLWLWW